MKKKIIYTTNQAQQNFTSMVKDVSEGGYTATIKMRGAGSVVLMSLEEYEGWLETLDILSNPEEAAALRKSMKESIKDGITHEELLKEFGLENDPDLQLKS